MRGQHLLQRYLDDKKLTQDEFAQLAGVPQPQVSMWLSGRRRPNIDSAYKIAEATRNRVPVSSWRHDEAYLP